MERCTRPVAISQQTPRAIRFDNDAFQGMTWLGKHRYRRTRLTYHQISSYTLRVRDVNHSLHIEQCR
jgi:hypothetical protein